MNSTDTHSRDQAQAQLESIMEMVAALDSEDESEQEQARDRIQEDPLEIQVRSGWHNPGEAVKPSEYTILLCTGGPACRIIGELSEHGEPESARIEEQDWWTPWTDYSLNEEQERAVLAYAGQFFYGE